MFYAEKRAKELLKKEGFDIHDSFYVSDIPKIKKTLARLKFPVVVKVFGRSIVHKNRLGGVDLNLRSYEDVLDSFGKMRRIKGFEGIIIQEQVKGKNVFLGIKKTPEFGHVAGVGSGGTDVEEKKDISFRVFPFEGKDIREMLRETELSKRLNNNEKNIIEKNILKLGSFIKKHPRVSELDINPLIVRNNMAKVIDARIVFE